MNRHDRYRLAANLPDGWWLIFGPVPGRSSRVRCLLCGKTGYGWYGRVPTRDFAGRPVYYGPDGNSWQIDCIAGHPYRCETCRRPFTSGTGLAAHQRCTLHHVCCLDHTTVPEWKNPFTKAVAA